MSRSTPLLLILALRAKPGLTADELTAELGLGSRNNVDEWLNLMLAHKLARVQWIKRHYATCVKNVRTWYFV